MSATNIGNATQPGVIPSSANLTTLVTGGTVARVTFTPNSTNNAYGYEPSPYNYVRLLLTAGAGLRDSLYSIGIRAIAIWGGESDFGPLEVGSTKIRVFDC